MGFPPRLRKVLFMTRINDEFMEAYKQLDKLCKELFLAEKGVTSYIDEMKRITDGPRFVSCWNETRNQLWRLRDIRNRYVHETGNTYVDICSPADIQWLYSFYNAILHTSDPLALYRRATTQNMPGRAVAYQQNYPTSRLHDADQRNSILSCFLIVLLLMLGAIAVVLIHMYFL